MWACRGRIVKSVGAFAIFVVMILSVTALVLSMRSPGGIGYLAEAAHFVLRIFVVKPASSAIPRGKKLMTMTRLVVAPLIEKDVSATRPQRVIDFQVYFLNHFSSRILFSEIFVDECYYFTSSNPKPFIIDGGGNIGMASLYFKALYPDAQILIFEPGRHCFDVLRRNMEANNITQVQLINKALSNKNGETALFGGDGAMGASLFAQGGDGGAQGLSCTVACAKLSDYVTRPVDLLKLDVEGSEHMVLDDLVASGKLRLIRQMVLEYHHHGGGKREDLLGNFLATLERHNFGYQIKLCNRGNDLCDAQNLIIHAYNKALLA